MHILFISIATFSYLKFHIKKKFMLIIQGRDRRRDLILNK